jgi:two-component system response regulator FixJ
MVYVVNSDPGSRNAQIILFNSAGFKVRAFRSGAEFLNSAPLLSLGCLSADIDNLDGDGFTFLEQLEKVCGSLPMIIMAEKDKAASLNAVKPMIADLLEKPVSEDQLIDAVRKAQGRNFPSSSGAKEALAAHLDLLTTSERQILERIVSGMPNRTIATDLGIELRAVEMSRVRIMNKLGVASLGELIGIALAAGIKLFSFRRE